MVGAFFENMNGETEMKTNCPLGLVGQSRVVLVRESSGSRFGIRGSHTSEARGNISFLSSRRGVFYYCITSKERSRRSANSV